MLRPAVLCCMVLLPFSAHAEASLCAYYDALAFHDIHTQSAGGALAHVAATCASVEEGAASYPDDAHLQAAHAAYVQELERVRAVILEANTAAFDDPMPMGNGQTRYGLGPFALRHIVRTSGLAQAEASWHAALALARATAP